MSAKSKSKILNDFTGKDDVVPTLQFSGQAQKEPEENEIKFYPNRVFVNNLDCYHGKHISHVCLDVK